MAQVGPTLITHRHPKPKAPSGIVAHSVFGRALRLALRHVRPWRPWLLQNESVSFQRRHATEIVAETFAEDGREISEVGPDFLSGICCLDTRAANGAIGRRYAQAGRRHLQTVDRDQY